MQHNYSILYSNIIRNIDRVIYGGTKTRKWGYKSEFYNKITFLNLFQSYLGRTAATNGTQRHAGIPMRSHSMRRVLCLPRHTLVQNLGMTIGIARSVQLGENNNNTKIPFIFRIPHQHPRKQFFVNLWTMPIVQLDYLWRMWPTLLENSGRKRLWSKPAGWVTGVS